MVLPYINMNLPRVYTFPHPEPPSHLPPRTTLLGHPSNILKNCSFFQIHLTSKIWAPYWCYLLSWNSEVSWTWVYISVGKMHPLQYLLDLECSGKRKWALGPCADQGQLWQCGCGIETEKDCMVLGPPPHSPHHVLCLPFACGKLQSKDKFNQRSEKCWNKAKQSKETK